MEYLSELTDSQIQSAIDNITGESEMKTALMAEQRRRTKICQEPIITPSWTEIGFEK